MMSTIIQKIFQTRTYKLVRYNVFSRTRTRNISSDKLEILQTLLNSKIKNTNTINLLNELKEYAKSLEEPDTSNDELDKSGLQGQKGIKEKVTKGNKTQFK